MGQSQLDDFGREVGPLRLQRCLRESLKAPRKKRTMAQEYDVLALENMVRPVSRLLNLCLSEHLCSRTAQPQHPGQVRTPFRSGGVKILGEDGKPVYMEGPERIPKVRSERPSASLLPGLRLRTV